MKKEMRVKESTFRRLDDPFENGKSKKYVFYVKVVMYLTEFQWQQILESNR